MLQPPEFQVWYHAALMESWREVVREQFALAAHVGLTRMQGAVLGAEQDRREFTDMAATAGIDFHIAHESQNFREFEFPTVDRLWEQSKSHPEWNYLYWHTKGASKGPRGWEAWRRAMQAYTIALWPENLELLKEYTLVGANLHGWRSGPPHYSGNFWLARGSWLAHLAKPSEWSKPGHAWTAPGRRHRAEMWLCSRKAYRPYSHCGMNQRWQRGEDLPPDGIEGFDYDTLSSAPPQDMHVVTVCTRPENLAKLAPLIPAWAKWWIVYSKPPESIPANCYCSLVTLNCHQGRSRNTAFDKIQDGYIWCLDDDNIPHPDFFSTIRPLLSTPGKVFYFNCDYGPRLWNLKASFPPVPRRVDMSQCVFDRSVVGDLRMQEAPLEDGVFFRDLFRKNRSAWQIIDRTLCYHNKLSRK